MAEAPTSHARPKPPTLRIYASIVVAFGWLVFIALWLLYYATSFGIVQNIGVLLLYLVIVGILETLLWVPWSMRQAG